MATITIISSKDLKKDSQMFLLLISFILLSPFCTSKAVQQGELTPENTIVVYDLDDTVIMYTPFYRLKVVGYGLSFNPITSFYYLLGLNGMHTLKKKPIPGNQDATHPKIIGGGFLQLTYAGIHEENLRPYVKGLIDLIWSNTIFKEGIPELLTYLHEKGYELWIATNKDHVSYTQVVESLEDRSMFKLSPLIKQSFVTWPTKDTIEKLYTFKSTEAKDAEFQSLIDLIPTIRETGTIHHSHAPKPAKEYYETMNKYTDGKKIVFFDDKKENITEANKFNIQAYRVNNCRDIIEQLEKLKILNPSPTGPDREFYEKLNKKTLLKKILFWV
jgi:FMN phosphatase YigB (HAD superfamily)